MAFENVRPFRLDTSGFDNALSGLFGAVKQRGIEDATSELAGLTQQGAGRNALMDWAKRNPAHPSAQQFTNALAKNTISPPQADPMADIKRQQAELGLVKTQAEIDRMKQPQTTAPKYMVVNGRLVRTDDTGVADVTPGTVQQAKPSYTPAETAVDRNYAKSYEEEVVGGGLADVQKNIGQLEGVYGDLTGGKKNLTGPVVGRMPDMVNSVINPAAVDARESVEEVVQRNLRIILGAQFTNEEGKRLIARAYNPALDEQTNAKRVGNLINAMKQAYASKQAAAQYYEQNGTLKGFQGRKDFTIRDFEDAIESNKVQGRLSGGGQTQQPAAPKTPQEYQALPPGTPYMAPDGSMRVKP